MKAYDKKFYDSQYEGSIRSASKYLSHLFRCYRPSSIVDFGCGIGSWLYAAERLGVDRLIGLDGPWVGEDQLLTKKCEFHAVNFQSLGKTDLKCDLAISVEVAEHFDQAFADDFVELVSGAADLIIFGAAIPGQGGEHHVNEQPQSYWVEKFAARGFVCYDYFRPAFWDDDEVEYWYRQNTLLFVRASSLSRYPFLSGMSSTFVLDVIHPELFRRKKRMPLRRADVLREAAIELESEDLELALLLMRKAAKARPDGKFIAEKLRSYEAMLGKG